MAPGPKTACIPCLGAGPHSKNATAMTGTTCVTMCQVRSLPAHGPPSAPQQSAAWLTSSGRLGSARDCCGGSVFPASSTAQHTILTYLAALYTPTIVHVGSAPADLARATANHPRPSLRTRTPPAEGHHLLSAVFPPSSPTDFINNNNHAAENVAHLRQLQETQGESPLCFGDRANRSHGLQSPRSGGWSTLELCRLT